MPMPRPLVVVTMSRVDRPGMHSNSSSPALSFGLAALLILVNGAVVDVMKQVRTDIVLNIAVADRQTDAANLLESQPEVENVQIAPRAINSSGVIQSRGVVMAE